jgi:hypothetical protein
MWSSVIIGGLLPKSDSSPELHRTFLGSSKREKTMAEARASKLADPVLIV